MKKKILIAAALLCCSNLVMAQALKLEYNGTTYMSTAIDAAGEVNYNAVGSDPLFIYNNLVNYGADYSADFVDLSLIHKGYADDTYMPITAFPTLGSANQLLGVDNAGTAHEYKTLATGTSGTDVNIANSTGTVTINVPSASATARGVVSTSAQTFEGIKTFGDGLSTEHITPLTNGGTLNFGTGLSAWTVDFVTTSKTPITFSSLAPHQSMVLGVNSLAISTNITCTNPANNEGTILGRFISTTEAIIAGEDKSTTGWTAMPVRPGRSLGNCNNCSGLGLLLQGGQGTGTGAGGGISFQVKSADGSGTQIHSVLSTAMYLEPSTGELGIGFGLTPAAKLHVLSTTEQQRLAYDASNYLSTTVGSSGVVTMNATGTGTPEFILSDRLGVDGMVYPVTDNAHTLGDATHRWSEIFCTNATINTSDETKKTNIQELNYGIADLMKLKPVSYNWIENDNGRRLGLLAQETERVINEVVVRDEQTNNYGIRYTELIPVLVKSIQDQQKMIAQLQANPGTATTNTDELQKKLADKDAEIASLKSDMTAINNKLAAFETMLNSCCQANTGNTNTNSKPASTLEQNMPNPFNGETTIGFHIVGNYNAAFIGVYDMNGREINKIAIAHDATQVTLAKGLLMPGMYTYSLVIDNDLIDTKRMIVTGN